MNPPRSLLTMMRLPRLSPNCSGGRQRFVRGREGPHVLDQAHDGYGVHEVHAEHFVRPLGGGRHLDDRDRRRVAGQDRVRRTDLIQLGEGALFDLGIFGGGLDDQVADGEVFETGGAAQSPERRVALGGGQLAALDRRRRSTFRCAGDPSPAARRSSRAPASCTPRGHTPRRCPSPSARSRPRQQFGLSLRAQCKTTRHVGRCHAA